MMFEAAIWEADPNSPTRTEYEHHRAAKIAAMPREHKEAWNDLCEFIAHEISGVALDVMASGQDSPCDYSLAHIAAVRACKLETQGEGEQ